MSCKIAQNPSAVQPIDWHAVLVARKTAPLTTRPANSPDSDDALEKKLDAERESLRRAELASCRETALQEGLLKGRQESANEVKGAADRVAAVVRDLQTWKRKLRADAEADVVKLSLAIARRILHRELTADPESIQGLVHAGLKQLQNREISTIFTSPAAADSVRSALERSGITPAVPVVPDPKMQLGDIVFETALGNLDASVATQLKEIERGFADRLGLP